SILPEKVKEGEVAIVNGTPFFKINVVYVGIDFYRVNQADVHTPNFDMEFFLWFKWRGDVDVENLAFLNENEGNGQRVELRRNFSTEKGAPEQEVKWIAYKVKGLFFGHYDLRLFPFDTQRLELKLTHRSKNANKIQLVADREIVSRRSVK